MWDAPTAEKHLEEAVVPDEFADGIRIDAFLARIYPENSRAFFQKCIDEGRVYLNGRIVRKSTKALPGNVVEFSWPEPEDTTVHPENIPLDILYEDTDIIVVNKPAGLVVHPARGNTTGTLVHGLLFHEEDVFEEMMDDLKRPGIVHRLDKDTSGALVVAKSMEAWTTLKATFKEHDLDKVYLAIALGEFKELGGTVDAPIGRHPTNRMRMAVVKENGKDAISKYKVLAQANGCALVKVKILTGRTHQIRVHLSHIGHPVLGDPFYGGQPKNTPYPATRQMLHAWKLNIPHPATGKKTLFTAPLPDDFKAALAALALPNPEAESGRAAECAESERGL